MFAGSVAWRKGPLVGEFLTIVLTVLSPSRLLSRAFSIERDGESDSPLIGRMLRICHWGRWH